MKTPARKLYRLSCRFILLFCTVLFGLLCLGSFLFTCYSVDMTTQKVLTRLDNPLTSLLGCALFLGAAALYAALGKRVFSRRALTASALLWILCVGALLIVFGKTVPAADAMSVYSAAQELAAGNTGVIHPTESYLSYYPQQIGLLAFFELLHRLWGLFPIDAPAYHFIKCLYVLFACAILLFQKETVKLLWKDERAQRLYLLIAGAHLPFLMYTSFVYGEIPSFAAFSAGSYFLLRLFAAKTDKPWKNVLLCLPALSFLTLSVLLRKNSLILIIAVLIVTVLEGLRTKKGHYFFFAALCALCCFSILPLTQKFYELRAGNSLSSGVPAASYLAMGMQESSRANGWYNGFNFETYQSVGLDREACIEISRSAIRERMAYFREHPGYAAEFYLQKHLSQWADGTYASRQATLAAFGGRSSFFSSLYEGSLSRLFIEYANLYQNILYFGVFFFVLSRRPKTAENNLPVYLGLIGVTGGFLFHIAWEANARYIFPYSLLMMPYCARGISLLFGLFSNTSSRS